MIAAEDDDYFDIELLDGHSISLGNILRVSNASGDVIPRPLRVVRVIDTHTVRVRPPRWYDVPVLVWLLWTGRLYETKDTE